MISQLADPPHYSRPDLTLGPGGPWPYPLAGQYKLQDTPDPTPNCVKNPPQIVWNKLWDPWALPPDSRNTSACQESGTNPRKRHHPPVGRQQSQSLQDPTLPTTEAVLAPGSPRVLNLTTWWPDSTKQQPVAHTQGGAWQPTGRGASKAHPNTYK